MIRLGNSLRVSKCAYCTVQACYKGEFDLLPNFCPMKNLNDVVENAKKELYSNNVSRELATKASLVEAEGYMKWPRLREIIEYSRKLGVKRIGIAFCIGFRREANYTSQALENAGFEVCSVCCKVGGINKLDIGIPKEFTLRKGEFEAICNPIGQAMVLNALETELNVVIGLCVGHDSLFYRYSRAPAVTLIAKDRVTGHNPAAALYTGYYQKIFGIKPSLIRE